MFNLLSYQRVGMLNSWVSSFVLRSYASMLRIEERVQFCSRSDSRPCRFLCHNMKSIPRSSVRVFHITWFYHRICPAHWVRFKSSLEAVSASVGTSSALSTRAPFSVKFTTGDTDRNDTICNL